MPKGYGLLNLGQLALMSPISVQLKQSPGTRGYECYLQHSHKTGILLVTAGFALLSWLISDSCGAPHNPGFSVSCPVYSGDALPS